MAKHDMAPIDQYLEKQYTPSLWSDNSRSRSEMLTEFSQICTEGSKHAVETVRNERNIHYGNSPNEVVDIFYPDSYTPSNDYPMLIFIHGGFWNERFSNKDLHGYIATPFTHKGVVVVNLEYDLAPDVTLSVIVHQIGEAMNFVLSKFANSRCVYLSGHSAGAHLACMYMATAKEKLAPQSKVINTAVLLSGVYDLRPLLKTSVNNSVRMTEAEASALSPVTVINDIASYCRDNSVKVLVAVGTYESPAFITQSKILAQKLCDAGVDCDFFMLEGKNHFDGITDMMQPDYPLNLRILKMMDM